MFYERFYEYIRDCLYGRGLSIVGYHLNGALESFDSMFEDAEKYATNDVNVKELWEEFGDVPMNPITEEIEIDWHGFPIGTHREDIWHWFENEFNVSVHSLMYGDIDDKEVNQ